MEDENTLKLTAFCKKAVIVIVDFILYFLSNAAIVYLTMGGHVRATEYSGILFNYLHLFITLAVLYIINKLLDLYKSVWTFAGVDEIARTIVAALLSAFSLFFFDRIIFAKLLHFNGWLPFYAYFLMFVLEFVALCAPRIGFRLFKRYTGKAINLSGKHKRVMIVGAGFMGDFFINELIINHYKDGYPVLAVDDNPVKMHKRINGVKVRGTCAEIPQLAQKYDIDIIMICLPSASRTRQKEIIDIAMQTKCAIKISPSVNEFLEDGAKARKIRNIEIRDLLARPEVKLDKKVCRYLIGKTVLVTGGGGSIGSEICKQVARYSPKSIIIFDIYENCAFELENDMKNKYGDQIDVHIRIGSVRDKDRLKEVFEEFLPDVVFHAAAHKHVPLMESSPCEAVKNNVFGTLNVAEVCNEFKVKRMVTLSTDKAVNPTNVMGCTKRITELIVQYMNTVSESTVYAAVRFGNVLGSHGSVIPIFKKQIEEGGPITLTHPDIERYFMTIPEAAQLVCQAGGLAKGGEVFVLDMGEPVKIKDLAVNMIKLAGYDVDDIGIKITGLRPGEKMYEELALESEMETRSKTALEKIFVTQPIEIDDKKFAQMINDLHNIDESNVRETLEKYVPNYHPAANSGEDY